MLIGRATQIIHAVASRRRGRGWSVRVPSESTNGPLNWTGVGAGHLQITVDAEAFWLRLHEHGVHTRGVWEEAVERYRNVG